MDVEVLQLAASALVKDIALVSDIQSLLDAVMVRGAQYCHVTHCYMYNNLPPCQWY